MSPAPDMRSLMGMMGGGGSQPPGGMGGMMGGMSSPGSNPDAMTLPPELSGGEAPLDNSLTEIPDLGAEEAAIEESQVTVPELITKISDDIKTLTGLPEVAGISGLTEFARKAEGELSKFLAKANAIGGKVESEIAPPSPEESGEIATGKEPSEINVEDEIVLPEEEPKEKKPSESKPPKEKSKPKEEVKKTQGKA